MDKRINATQDCITCNIIYQYDLLWVINRVIMMNIFFPIIFFVLRTCGGLGERFPCMPTSHTGSYRVNNTQRCHLYVVRINVLNRISGGSVGRT